MFHLTVNIDISVIYNTKCKIRLINMSSFITPIMLTLNIGDQLTSISCGHIVVELLKFIAYQRLQIPYTYQWLKQVVNKKKMSREKKDTFKSERHFFTASAALDNLDFVIKSLLKEISGPTIPEEVCIALGSTSITCKEVYRILLPNLCHKPQCHSKHIASDQKIQTNVFRTLVTSEQLNKVLFNTLPPTNMYVFIRKRNTNRQDPICRDNFVLINGCRFSKSTKVVVIDFRTQNRDNLTCCNDFPIFDEIINEKFVNLNISKHNNENNIQDYREIESNEAMSWYQSNYVMKGFKDCIVSGSSITNKWMEL